MRVLSLLGPSGTSIIRSAADDNWIVRDASIADVLVELASRSGGVVLLDPVELHGGAFEELLHRSAQAAAKLVLYGPDVLAIGVRKLVAASLMAHVEALDSSAARGTRYAKLIIALPGVSLPAQLLRVIGGALLRLPGPAAAMAVRLFTGLPMLRSVQAMYRLAACHQTSLCRRHHNAGICPPKHLLAYARVARACHCASAGERDQSAVAAWCALKPQALDTLLRSMAGTAYIALVDAGVPDFIVERLAARILRPAFHA